MSKVFNRTVVVQTDSTPSSNLKMVRVEETPIFSMELRKSKSVSFLLGVRKNRRAHFTSITDETEKVACANHAVPAKSAAVKVRSKRCHLV
jgi:hypothetical protein